MLGIAQEPRGQTDRQNGQVDGQRGDRTEPRHGRRRHQAWNRTWANTSSSSPAKTLAHHHAGDPPDQTADRQTVRRAHPRRQDYTGTSTPDPDRPPGAARKFRSTETASPASTFAVAETGTSASSRTRQRPHVQFTVARFIAITGIERWWKLGMVPPLFSISPARPPARRSTYFNVITGPRRGGIRPRRDYLVLVDNGRSQAYADEQLRERCSASAAAPP